MQFPRTEAEIAKLGEIVVQGLEQATEDFPAPPVPPADLRIKLEAVHAATAAAVAAESAFREHHAVKDEALEDLADSLKANLKYAEFAVREHPEKLNQLGGAGGATASRSRRPAKYATSPSVPRAIRGSFSGGNDRWMAVRPESTRSSASCTTGSGRTSVSPRTPKRCAAISRAVRSCTIACSP